MLGVCLSSQYASDLLEFLYNILILQDTKLNLHFVLADSGVFCIP